MARSHLKNTIIFSICILLIFLHTPKTLSYNNFQDEELDDDDQELYVLDNPIPNFITRSRFLASVSVIRKGRSCNATSNNICNGVSANKGTSLLYCCKKHCRNVLGDKNNCGRCGNKCKFGEFCCNKSCVSVSSNVDHCGKCNRKCVNGVPCNYGSCGYA
ncbi:protein GRIM REAPER [Mercurialis annua]|uniref:protein GRIM REAPER n=1 Tax=Mercurialis annua TaxID=3986 RepID=UPI00215F2BF7|nr:protein GRIM REAPER [Mercurialis annua]